MTLIFRFCTRLLLVLCLSAGPLLAQDQWFETDSLNAGLPPAPDGLDRSTPMAAIEAFLHLTERGHYSEAAHLLDLSDFARGDQAAEGATRAHQLSVVLERKVVVPWSSLADRPDGWLTGAQEDNRTGRVRRSILIDRLDIGSHAVPLRLNRIKPGDAPAVWVFARQSVDNIPRLHALYGPTELEEQLPAWAREKAFWGMYWWEVLLLPALIIAALAAATVAFRTLRRLGETAPYRWMRFVARSFKWPAAIILSAAILGLSTRWVLSVSGLLDAILGPILLVAYVAAATMAVVLIIDEIFDRISQDDPNELADPENSHLRSMATTISAARKFVIVIAILLATGVVLASVNAFNTLGFSLLASAGALTIVLGFAAREVLGNIMASVQIALNRSARIGDQLIFEGHFCTVERIHFTYVQLMIWNGTRLIVPVSYFVKDAFENWSLEDPAMVRPIELTLAQDADVARLREVFMALLAEYDEADVAPMERAKVHVVGQDVFGQQVRFELPAANPASGWQIECDVREALLARAAEIERDEGLPMLPPRPDDLPEA